MQVYFAVATMFLLVIMVIFRALMMRNQGIKAIQFGKIDKNDFLIPPFALFYFYLISSNAFNWPLVSEQILCLGHMVTPPTDIA